MYDKRQYPTFSHFRFLMSQLSRKTFSVLTELQNEKDKKNLAYFVFLCFLFKRGEKFYFTFNFVRKGVNWEVQASVFPWLLFQSPIPTKFS